MSIKQNIEAIRKKITIAAAQSTSNSSEIIIICVTKNRTCEEIYQALDAGIIHVGESKVQEAQCKIDALRSYAENKNIPCRFHMIGHLQTNKVGKAVQMFDMFQSIDNLKLCKKIDDVARSSGRISEVLIEVNTSKESSKFGVCVDDIIPFIEHASEFESLRVRGLMTMAPLSTDKEAARPYFRLLRTLRDRINDIKKEKGMERVTMEYLSMGMSHDFEIAVQEGANMVRIGSAIFEGIQ